MKKRAFSIVASALTFFVSLVIVLVLMVSWETIVYASAIPFGNKIPCYSSGSTVGDGRYVECSSCLSVVGIPDNGEGKCKKPR